MNCTHPKNDLVLLFYDELGPDERPGVEARVASCPECQAELASLRSLSAHIPRQPLLDVPEATMQAIRQTTDRRLAPAPRTSVWPVLSRVSIGKWAVAAVIVIAAFGLGRMSVGPVGVGGSVGPEAVTSSLQSARVSDVAFDSQTGVVRVAYETVKPGALSGTVDDSDIQQLLGLALHAESPPLSRLRAARALAESRVRPDPMVVGALEGVLAADPNAATRLQALKALQQMHEDDPVSGTLRDVLLDLVVNEPNTAIRMRALDAVTRTESPSMDLAHALEVAAQDQNPHIARQASLALAAGAP